MYLYVMCADPMAWTSSFLCTLGPVPVWLAATSISCTYNWDGVVCARVCLYRWLYRQLGVPPRSIWWTDAPTPSTGRPTRFRKFPPPSLTLRCITCTCSYRSCGFPLGWLLFSMDSSDAWRFLGVAPESTSLRDPAGYFCDRDGWISCFP